MDSSIIQLTPSTQAFVDARATTLGPWVIGGALDCILMGVVFCQIQHFFKNRLRCDSSQFDTILASVALALSILKTTQVVAIIWEQNVMSFGDPDAARKLANGAWWQASAPLLTAATGFCVQSFFAYRFFRLTANYPVVLIVALAMLLGLVGACMSTYYILRNQIKLKVTWLMIHLVCVCSADIMITVGTVFALNRTNSGLQSTTSLVRRLLRLVFEAAIPPACIATVDLILTQTLGSHLLWHLVTNYLLSKAYIVSLLFTLNSIADYRSEPGYLGTNGKISFTLSAASPTTRDTDIELGSSMTGGNLYLSSPTLNSLHPLEHSQKQYNTVSEERLSEYSEPAIYS
ncbi:hypothetical protein C8J56DRAFT_1055404 [Mycena floridula]|nr:hypothetical protein C8J56DRAFT_1055404 [Mycena floridula]